MLLAGITLSVLPLLVILFIVIAQNKEITEVAFQESRSLATDDLRHMAEGALGLCVAQEEVLGKVLPPGANLAEARLKAIESVRRQILATKVGKTGYIFVFDSKANYIISLNGARDGQSMWEAKDANGRFVIQDMITAAKAQKPGETAEVTYPWQNPGDKEARLKIAKVVYFPAWDWTIGVSSYEDEFMESPRRLAAIGSAGTRKILLVLCIVTALASLIWIATSSALASQLRAIAEQLGGGAAQIASASKMIADAGQSVAAGASEQAAALSDSSTTLNSMTQRGSQVSQLTQDADQLMRQNLVKSNQSLKALSEMTEAMNKIVADSAEMGKIIKTIDEIAFQTNILALNAAVEAARAGDAGAGFAVVADEVRSLASRAAEAAKSTQQKLETNTGLIKHASTGVNGVNTVFKEIVQTANDIGGKVQSISVAIGELASNMQTLSNGTQGINSVVQANAANAEEAASSAEELSAQAQEISALVNSLVGIVKGAKA